MKGSEKKTGTHIGLIFILNCISSAWMCCSRKKKSQPETFSGERNFTRLLQCRPAGVFQIFQYIAFMQGAPLIR